MAGIIKSKRGTSLLPVMLTCVLLLAAVGPSMASIGPTWTGTRPSAFAVKTVADLSTTSSNKMTDPTRLPFGLSDSHQIRGGAAAAEALGNVPWQKIIETIVNTVTSTARAVLPPTVALTRTLVAFYRTLPRDVIIAQVGLVYCFCGGCYPALFAAVQAAQVCGLPRMLEALNDLTDEALIAVDATQNKISGQAKSAREVFTQTTLVVMRSVDPMKINNAVSALYTTWLGVSTVLEQEFARTINYAVTLGNYLEPAMRTVVAPPMYLAVPKDYHKWVPITLGWATKAMAMRVAWRLQRVLTASTSAVLGGLMFSRAMMRIMFHHGVDRAGINENHSMTLIDDGLGYTMAAAGIYVQLGDGNFDPKVKFPFTLLTWPFEIAENWIQWKITKM